MKDEIFKLQIALQNLKSISLSSGNEIRIDTEVYLKQIQSVITSLKNKEE